MSMRHALPDPTASSDSNQESQPGSLQPEAVAALIRAAHEGDEAAYGRLHAAFVMALAGSIRRATGYSSEQALAWADETWQKNRTLILRLPEEGGYTSAMGAFHRYVLKHCSGWSAARSEENLVNRHEVLWPRTEDGELMDLPDPNALAAHQLVIRCRQFALLLQIVFHPKVGYPHQQLAFVLSRYVYGRTTPRGLDGDPAIVKERHADMPLHDLAELVVAEYRALAFPESPFGGQPCPCFAGLYARLDLTVGELMRSDGPSLKQFVHLAQRRVGQTLLRDYFVGTGDGAEAMISLWTSRVSQRIRKLLQLNTNLPAEQMWSRLEGLAPEESW
jgi:hypothetical protein